MMTANPRSPQARRQAQTRRDIIDHAHRMIVEQGISGLSLRAVADSIDYTPGALYNYFANKDALIDAVRADCFERLNSFILMQIAEATDSAERLLLGGLAYIEYANQNPEEYYLMFNMPPSRATTGTERAQAMRSLLAIVESGIAVGQFASQDAYDAATIAAHCWATVHGIASLQATVLLDDALSPDDTLAVSRVILQKVIDTFTVGGTPDATDLD